MIRCFILLLYAYTIVGIGYDSGGGDRTTCGRPYRAGRLYQPPCDLARMGYCSQAGQLYPWRAVKRFVKDNQGLMRRMYGDERHGHVLRAELEDDEESEEEWEKNERERRGYRRWRPEPIRFARYQPHDEIDNDLDEDLDLDFDNPYAGESRYLRGDLTNEDVLNTKFVISEQEAAIAIKLAELKAAAHFRPAIHRSTSTRKTPLSTSKPVTTTTTTTTRSITTAKQTIEDNAEAITVKGATTKATTTSILLDSTEGSTLTTTSSFTTDDFMDHSTIDTTTDRTEILVNNTSPITKKSFTTEKPALEKQATEKTIIVKSTTRKTTASDRLGEDAGNNDSVTIEVNDQKSDNDNFKNENVTRDDAEDTIKSNDQIGDEIFDQTVESSENSEVYSDSDGNIKQVETSKTPAILFQDMEEEPSKKKMPMNFNKMKGVNACPVKEEVVAPFWANNTRGEVLALLNMYPFEQYVHWEKCTFEHRQMYCREGCRCEQQYRLHRLLAYDPNNECRGIFSDWFRFPSCCVCKCYDMPPEFRVTSRSPRVQLPHPEKEEDYD